MKLKSIDITILLILLTLGSISFFGQDTDSIAKGTKPTKSCEQKDIRDLLRKKGKPPKPQKRTSLLILPNISSNPTNGVLLGVRGNSPVYPGPRENTRLNLNLDFAIGIKSQGFYFSGTETF